MSFGSSKRPAFKPTPYGYTRQRRGIPRWLVLLISGIVLGAGGVVFLQRSYGPPRLTAEQSEQLRMDLNSANLEKQQLQTQAKQLRTDLEQARQSLADQTGKLEQLRADHASMEAGVAELIAAIPPDPRGTSPGIRAADMVTRNDRLAYNTLLIQELPEGATEAPAFDGAIKLIAAGHYSNGQTVYVDIATLPLHMGRYTQIKGESELPKGFRARQVTVQITAAGSDKITATRTIRVTQGK
ncbi:hypothetical protein [Castellaniella sp. GW247-6E4]|uniref:hypothetical protein n=1 Tax=Castellaniella sp. GW247-6E4 TaxID=3140380 RepID=UPI0033153ACE